MSNRLRRSSLWWLLAIALLLPAGCQTEPSRPDAQKPSPQAIEGVHQCADNLQEICGLLAQYHILYHHLPQRLEELVPLNDGKPLSLTCSVSGKPYVYVSAGLLSPNDRRILMVYDAEPAHAGMRNGIVASPPDATHAASFFVIQLTSVSFSAFGLGVAQ